MDYLLTGDPGSNVPLSNTRLLDRFRALEASETDDRETVIKLIDALIEASILKRRFQRLASGEVVAADLKGLGGH